MGERIKKLSALFREFGFLFSFKYCYYRLTGQWDRYIKLVYEFLCDNLADVIAKYSLLQAPSQACEVEKKRKVWVCWWQGYDRMPDFCKMCYQQMKNVLRDPYELVLITKDNYKEYAQIPKHIEDKMNKGYIPVTQFCDVLRQSLLYHNGGMWIDASVWCTEKINDMLAFAQSFWSVKLHKIDDPTVWGQLISQCKWSSFLLGGGQKGEIIYGFVLESMSKYFEVHNYVIDYFLQNLLIRVAYENVPAARQAIDDVKESNPHIYDLYRYMDQPFEQEVWNTMVSDTAFFKLTQKRGYELENNGNRTFYAYLKETSGYE